MAPQKPDNSIPSVYADLLTKLNAMGGVPNRYAVVQDPKFHDRVMFSDTQTKKKFALNLTNAQADRGRVWLVGSDGGGQQKIVGPHITADMQSEVGPDYNSDVANINYNATSSTGMLASMVYKAFNRAGKQGDPNSIFRALLSQGDRETGLSPAPDVPRGYKATQNIAMNQIGLSFTSNGQRANPDEKSAMINDFVTKQSNAFNPNFPQANIENDVSSDARPISMQYLFQGGYIPNEKGRLEPVFNKAQNEAIQAQGLWDLTKKPKTIAKSNKLGSGSDPATPYQLDENGIPVPLRARPTTNSNTPAYALSNVLMPGEDANRGHARQTYLFDNAPIAGAAIGYNNPNGVKADFWGVESTRSAKMPSLNYAKLVTGEQKLELNNYQNRTHGGGRPISIFGTLTTGDKSENIKVRQGPGTWHAGGGAQMTLPSYVNPTTGKWSSEAKEGYVESEGLKEQLQQALPGMPLKFDRVSTPTMQFAGINESTISEKGQSIKTSVTYTGLDMQVSGANVTRFTGDLKGNEFLYGYFGGLNYKQMTGLAKKWDKSGNALGGKVLDYLRTNHAESARQGREMNIDFDAMSKSVGYEGGGGGLGMMVDWFSQTIRSAKRGSSENRRNIKNFGAGWASGKAKLGVVHADALEEMRSDYRRANSGMSVEDADASFNKTFKMTQKGVDRKGRPLYSGVQKLSDKAMVINMLQPTRIENVHGPRMTQDWLQAVSRQYPQFAERIGANVDTFRPQGAAQASAAGILKYAAWQGQKRDEYNDSSIPASGEMPTNYREIDDETLSGIQSHLSAASAETSSPVELLQGVVDKFFPESKDSSADSLYYSKSLDQYVPNPRAILNSTFSELGTEAAGLAKPTVGMFKKLGGIVNDGDLTPEQRKAQGLAASAPLQKAAEKLITGSGNFLKRLLGTNIAGAASGRYGTQLNLANDEARISYEHAMSIATRSGFSGNAAKREARRLMRSEASFITARQPMGVGAVENRNLVNEDEYAKDRFESPEAYDSAISEPGNRGRIDMPLSQSTSEIGDSDFDSVSGAVGTERVGNEMVPINDPDVKADVMTAEKIKAQEETIFPDKGMRDSVNATVKQFVDYKDKKDVVGSVLAQKKQYKASDVLRTSWDRLMNKTLGMGVGYNPRRAVGGAMSSGGYNAKEIANVMSSMPGMYQPALDTALTGREASGVSAASIISKPYFHQGYEKKDNAGNVLPRERLLRLARTGETTRRNTRIENADGSVRILPEKATPKTDINMDEMLGTNNPQKMLDMSGFVSEGFARGYSLDGKQVGMSPQQYAGWFASPGDAENLAGKLDPKDTSQWSAAVGSYHRQLYNKVKGEGGTHIQGLEKVLSTPAMMSTLIRAGSKSVNGRDTETGKDLIEGSTEVFNLLKSNLSPGFMKNLTTGMVSHATDHRLKDMNLSSLHPKNLAIAAENMGNDIKGVAMRTLARVMDVGFGVARPARKQAQIDDGRTLRAKVQARTIEQAPTAAQNDMTQNLLEKMASQIQSGGVVDLSPAESQAMESITTSEEPSTPASLVTTSEPDLIERKRALHSAPPGQPPKPPKDIDFSVDPLEPEGEGGRKKSENPAGKTEAIRKQNDRKPQHTSFTVEGVHAKIMEYQNSAPSAVEQMHNVLTGMGMEGEQTPGSVRERAQQAYIADKAGFLSKLPSKLRKQLSSISGLQKESAMALFLAPQVPGLGQRAQGIQEDIAAAVATGDGSKLGGDIQAFASWKTMVGENDIKNPYAVMDANELAQSEEFQGAYKAMRPIMDKKRGRSMKELRQALAANPQAIEMLNLSEKMTTGENIKNLPSEISELSNFSKSVKKQDPDLLKRGSEVTALPTEEVSKLNEAYKEQAKAAKELRNAHKEGLKTDQDRLDFEARKTNAAYRTQLYGMLGQQAQGQVDRLQGQFAESGTLSTRETERLERAAGRADKFRKKQMEAEAESTSIQDEETAGKWGSAARRMLGGFGIMYMKSVFGFATSGLGYGTEDRLKYNQIQEQALYGATGDKNIQQNQAQILQNKMALAGGNFNAIAGAQQIFASAPIARDIWSGVSAGVGAWGYTQFAASQIGGKPGEKLGSMAKGIGFAAAGLSVLSDSFARSQDPVSLGQRLEQGNAGITDYAAYFMSGLKDGGNVDVERSRAAMLLTNTAAERGLTPEQMRNTQVDFRSYGSARTSGLARDIFTKGEMFSANNAYLLEKNQNLSQEAVAQATAFHSRSNIAISDKRITAIAEDAQFGGWAQATAQGSLAALGFTSSKMYARKPGEEFDALGKLHMRFAEGTYSEEEKAALQGGIQRASQLPGIGRVAGVGASGGAALDYGKLEKFLKKLEGLSDASFGVLQTQMQAVTLQQQAGLRNTNVTEAEVSSLATAAAGMNPEQQATASASANAFASQAQYRMNLGQKFQDQSYQFGNYKLGDRAREAIMGAPAGQEWLVGRALSMDPITLATASKRGLNLSGMAGMTTMNGTQIGANYAAMTDTSLSGQVTGLNWGTSSFSMGNISSAGMANNIWGSNWQSNKAFDQKAIQAGVSGYALPGTITLPDGQKMSSIGGTTGMQLYGSQLQRDQQLAMAGLQSQGIEKDIKYQHQMWGIEDKQRSLAHQNTMWSFDFQSKQINMNSRQFNEGQGLSQQQNLMQRGWTREDWGQQAMVRNMQWNWKQEDFQEESRFMTGRQRKIAERGMKRETIMHNIEEDQIDKQKGRQEELWKLEDMRFKMTKAHYEEGVQMQREQLKHSRTYYLENKKLEDEKIKLSRAHWEDEMKMQKQSIAISQHYAKEQHKLNVTMAQLSTATELMHGQMNTLTDDGMERLKGSLLNSLPVFTELANILDRISGADTSNLNSWSNTSMSPDAYGYTPPTESSGASPDYSYVPLTNGGSNSTQTINVHVGNDRLETFVIESVDRDLRIR